MSMENLMAFVEATLQDADLVAELSDAVTNTGDGVSSSSTVSAFATSRGFDVSQDEVEVFRVGMKSNLISSGELEGAELSDSELEMVSGGIMAGGCMPPPDDWFSRFPKAPDPAPALPGEVSIPGGSDWGCMPPPNKLSQLGLL